MVTRSGYLTTARGERHAGDPRYSSCHEAKKGAPQWTHLAQADLDLQVFCQRIPSGNLAVRRELIHHGWQVLREL